MDAKEYRNHYRNILTRYHFSMVRYGGLLCLIQELQNTSVPDEPVWKTFYLAQIEEYKDELTEIRTRFI